ncbi:lysozyme [Serratia ureilytica]|uniref:lysozyme n=1 Tax=Serratia ureilytica TaxID=300181 RepID=UPI0018D6B900|nr:lysozyme [Serratia ureilytica]MBH2514871.1 lysozyme [Serratia ureilytica]MBH2529745.1 lysozyme [Serratia ureilytica]
MKISNNGIDFLKRQEGEKLSAYKDTRGIHTIGAGHTGLVDGKPVAMGMTISKEKSSDLLRFDLQWTERAINTANVTLNQNQYDALCSLVFNIGASAFNGSTLLRKLKAGDYAGAADQFLAWKRAGNDPDILLPRRQRERALFLS